MPSHSPFAHPFLFLALLLLPALCSATPTLPHVARSSRCPVMLPDDEPSTDPSTNGRSPANRTAPDGRIVNGDLIADGLAPYLVALYEAPFTFSFKCTGTLVSQTWVLSAAHCNVDLDWYVALLARDSDEPAEFIPISSVTSHSSYLSEGTSRKFDIATIQLAEPAPSGAKFMKVNVNTAIPATDSFVRVAGFGDTVSGGDVSDDASGRLRQVDVPITSRRDCESAYGSVIDSNAQVCAGYLGDGGCDSCQGDSGGPMIQYTSSGEPILVGIVSSGRGCAEANFPGIYVRTAAFSTWMRTQTALEFTSATETEQIFRSGSKLGAGAIVGIVIAVLAVIVLIVGFVLFRRRRRGRTEETAAVVPPVQTPAAAGLGYSGAGPAPPAGGGAGQGEVRYAATGPGAGYVVLGGETGMQAGAPAPAPAYGYAEMGQTGVYASSYGSGQLTYPGGSVAAPAPPAGTPRDEAAQATAGAAAAAWTGADASAQAAQAEAQQKDGGSPPGMYT